MNAHRVKYLVVALTLSPSTRSLVATKDLNIPVKADPENAKAVFLALAEFGASMQGLAPADFEEPGPFFRIGRETLVLTFSRQFLMLARKLWA